MDISVLRDGKPTEITAELHEGKLGVLLTNALDTPIFAQPLQETLVEIDGKLVPVPTAIAGNQLLGGSRFIKAGTAKNQSNVIDWSDLRRTLYEVFSSQPKIMDRAEILVQNPTINRELVTIELSPSSNDIASALQPKFSTALSQQLFEPVYVVRSSGGNPIKAIQMGFDETLNMIVMTYLTIDRLFRRSVGVEQLRGPVGIIHIGSKIADRGMSYLLFFLAIISVNLAVLNFLPLPIVDGGLFLYLIYEKIFKKPPSIAFQNAAAMLGLGLIATLFIVTFYNDIVRLVG
jgi:RIP metalloprotease RseP